MKRTKNIPPLLLVALVVGQTGCETQAHKDRIRQQKAAYEADQAEKKALREKVRQREFESQYGPVRAACLAYLQAKQPGFEAAGFSFTPMAASFLAVTVDPKPKDGQSPATAVLLGAERFEGEDGKPYWRIDPLDKDRMDLVAARYGFAKDIDTIRERSSDWEHPTQVVNEYHRDRMSWFDTYLMWHMLMGQPQTVYVPYGPTMGAYPGMRGARVPMGSPSAAAAVAAPLAAYQPRSYGFRPYAPAAPPVAQGTPKSDVATALTQAIASRPGGSPVARTTAFGTATAFSSKGAAVSRGGLSVSRGGFGGAGAARGGGMGG